MGELCAAVANESMHLLNLSNGSIFCRACFALLIYGTRQTRAASCRRLPAQDHAFIANRRVLNPSRLGGRQVTPSRQQHGGWYWLVCLLAGQFWSLLLQLHPLLLSPSRLSRTCARVGPPPTQPSLNAGRRIRVASGWGERSTKLATLPLASSIQFQVIDRLAESVSRILPRLIASVFQVRDRLSFPVASFSRVRLVGPPSGLLVTVTGRSAGPRP